MADTTDKKGPGKDNAVVSISDRLQSVLTVSNHQTAPPSKSIVAAQRLAAVIQEEILKEKKNVGNHKTSEVVLRHLKLSGVRPEKKFNSRKATLNQFRCQICKTSVGDLSSTNAHILGKKHIREINLSKNLVQTLKQVPEATENHLDALKNALLKIEDEFGLSDKDIKDREDATEVINSLLMPYIPGCEIKLVGSSLSCFGLKSSNLNLGLSISGSQLMPHQAIIKVLEFIKKSTLFKNVSNDFSAKVPVICFEFTSYQCQLSSLEEESLQTTLLIRDYLKIDPRIRTLFTCLRTWANMCNIDNMTKGTLVPTAYATMMIYYLQKNQVLPCLQEKQLEPESEIYQSPSDFLSTFELPSDLDIAKLWIGFFRFYIQEFDCANVVVSIRTIENFVKEGSKWQTRCIVIEDAFNPKRSLSSGCSVKNLDFIQQCLLIGYFFFAVPRTKEGPAFSSIVQPQGEDSGVGENDSSSRGSSPFDIITLAELETSLDNLDLTYETFREKFGTELTPEEAVFVVKLIPCDKYCFDFVPAEFTWGQSPVVVCQGCQKHGHSIAKCPDDLPPLKKHLPPMDEKQKDILSGVCQQVMNDLMPSNEEMEDREYILQMLLGHIRKVMPTANIDMFGSSCNGFAISGSDMDFCLTFFGDPTGENFDSCQTIRKVAKQLRTVRTLTQVMPITAAKVPIVKFIDRETNLEGDISFYNILGLENTKMLKSYSSIDIRAKILGYMLKLYAKVCGIGDASKGTLSSYAYILMLIYYLQRTSPPILPVLQELHEAGNKPVNLVEKWNAWFFSDLKNLPAVWNGYGKNKQSLAELWVGFLNFYAFYFDWKNNVVSIRNSRTLTKLEKTWTAKSFAIEDPFNLDHNLGTGLTRRMASFIRNSFATSWEHFVTFDPKKPKLLEYFFQPKKLTPGEAPPKEGCWICNKTDHFAHSCPTKNAARNNQAADNVVAERRPKFEAKKTDKKTVSPNKRSAEAQKSVQAQNNKAANHEPLPGSYRTPGPTPKKTTQAAESPAKQSKKSAKGSPQKFPAPNPEIVHQVVALSDLPSQNMDGLRPLAEKDVVSPTKNKEPKTTPKKKSPKKTPSVKSSTSEGSKNGKAAKKQKKKKAGEVPLAVNNANVNVNASGPSTESDDRLSELRANLFLDESLMSVAWYYDRFPPPM